MGRQPIDELEVREKIIEVCRRLHQGKMLAATTGNISYRINDDRILITPSRKPKAFIEEIKEIAVTNLKGEAVSGQPSMERFLHISVYRQCPEARAVVHAHPPTLMAWAMARSDLKVLPMSSLPNAISAAGRIPFVPFSPTQPEEMDQRLSPYLPQDRAMILVNEGGLSWGENLEEAYNGIERMEHAARILYLAHGLGLSS